MKISGSKFQQITKIYQKNKPQHSGRTDSTKGDQAHVSREARELGRIQEILAQTPDIRAEKVEKLKMAIQLGTYEVKGEKIAEKMLEGYFVDRIIG
ncbi:MAG: flagellar biosynthesis anti-sigma factor FlgM [Halanaerobiales bacterium]|nr:flagellar biosynthesis anti-sigma factor FlgM [Halanaerobiales bacterium]